MKKMTEKTFQSMVVKVARLNGWLVYHTYDSRRCEPGFPDLTLVRGSTVMFIELKTDEGKLTHHQKEWLTALQQTPAIVQVWRPRNWKEIVQQLSRK